MLLHSVTLDVLPVNGLTNFDEVMRRALEDDYSISRFHRLAMSESWIVLSGCGFLHIYAPIYLTLRSLLLTTSFFLLGKEFQPGGLSSSAALGWVFIYAARYYLW
jgi:hypothetical protein